MARASVRPSTPTRNGEREAIPSGSNSQLTCRFTSVLLTCLLEGHLQWKDTKGATEQVRHVEGGCGESGRGDENVPLSTGAEAQAAESAPARKGLLGAGDGRRTFPRLSSAAPRTWHPAAPCLLPLSKDHRGSAAITCRVHRLGWKYQSSRCDTRSVC